MTQNIAPRWPVDPALFLDLDGTLLEFTSNPSDVRLSSRLAGVLSGLTEATNGAVAFISGRTLDDLDRLLGAGRFALAGVHGLQRRTAQGARTESSHDANAMAEVRRLYQQIAERYPQATLEDKQTALALHYRRCPELEEELTTELEARLDEMNLPVVLMRGKMVLEAKPLGASKGSAIEAFMRERPFAGRTPVFVGDDVTDEDGFRTVNELGGVSVKVDDGPTLARFRLPDPEAVIAWLEVLVLGR